MFKDKLEREKIKVYIKKLKLEVYDGKFKASAENVGLMANKVIITDKKGEDQ
jgi:hypothetical protein